MPIATQIITGDEPDDVNSNVRRDSQ